MAVVRNLLLLTLLSFCLPAKANVGSAFLDPLDRPAPAVRNLIGAHLNAVTLAGSRLVAVGARGLIMISDDAGANWSQVTSPVSSDLLAAHFPSARQGWIVGHEGVVLHSSDQGQTWVKQIDGRATARQLEDYYGERAAGGDQQAAEYLEGIKLNYKDGPEQALMDVWFSDENNGIAVGTFGTLLVTRDGGKSWESWMERVDNPELLHYMAIAGVGDEVFIVSERGIVFRFDKASDRFEMLETGYAGSFFSLAVSKKAIVAAGLRGTLYRSLDRGVSWEQVPTGLNVALTAAQVLPDGRLLLASVDGRVSISDAGLTSFETLPVPRPGRFSSLVVLPGGKAVTVGYSGVRVIDLK
ncbi:glycosyl hydrolase [Pseudomonas aeruginosa]|uniref:YCF48-related protein n=1 Tax=Pseudomonas aeruginosa TaxID=287 RepID=UPI0007C6406E|nr:YCF48-related protein [Pseudomonas aeruginosa]KSQ24994.2 hypothetical protein APB28_00515 [Pseudomonas aeruginosa]MCO1690119.1 glycosyl hydrolase [Pseudomonas aeruginosa]MCO1780375.1 glycosyl hydrolase [Pseudomonas aeruginosa]MCO1790139.1 glycosyl hydrolase [Pseudomonas aeruginosa]MCO1799221.1 glycosyl hydrolase [Pseudomonas aeruginosa]